MGRSVILYDEQLIDDPDISLFDADYHASNKVQRSFSSVPSDAGIGRARVCYFEHDGSPYVLKHYYRGGAVASIMKDKYLGVDVESSRSFQEWRLLKKMYEAGLPVPRVLAAHVERHGFYYRADLVTALIEDSSTLADRLTDAALPAQQWRDIGVTLKTFHHQNIYHADLNARNILIDTSGKVTLIDFDNSRVRGDDKSWKLANLARLNRSLLKFLSNEDRFCYSEDDWSALLAGYNA